MSDPKYEDWFHEALSTGQVSAAHDQQFQLCWQASRRAALEEAATAIKAEDDRMAEEDYMLDSDDCIRVIRALSKDQTK